MKLYIHCSNCGGGGYANINDLFGDYSSVTHSNPKDCEKFLSFFKKRKKEEKKKK